MAIGLGRMFGFKFLENFNYPYIACSIQEFWQRWHISLSSWFRDYLYIPLGGNRSTNGRTYLNLLIVFLATGIWHGANWTFICWGLWHGAFIVIERLGFRKILPKMPKFYRHVYLLFVVLIGWVFFRVEHIESAYIFISHLFGLEQGRDFTSLQYVNNKTYLFLLMGIALSVPIKTILRKFSSQLNPTVIKALQLLSIMVGLYLCTLHIASDSYNPFIYFRF